MFNTSAGTIRHMSPIVMPVFMFYVTKSMDISTAAILFSRRYSNAVDLINRKDKDTEKN
jgi:hypothetical protein